jgi:putative transposase
VIPFLAFPEEIRRIIYTTNSVESLHMQVRKTIKTSGHFPNDDAALRLIWLAIIRAKTTWRTCYKLDTSDGSPTHPLRRPHPR